MAPTFSGWLQPVEGTTPPEVFSRWTKVVCARISPPVGPSCDPTAWSNNQGIAPALTKFGSLEDPMGRAQTALVSSEFCHVARGVPLSDGLGLRKCVMICWGISAPFTLKVRNKVACGEKNVQEKPEADGRQM